MVQILLTKVKVNFALRSRAFDDLSFQLKLSKSKVVIFISEEKWLCQIIHILIIELGGYMIRQWLLTG